MRVARTLTGRPRPMSALEAMTGGPWLFAAVACLGLGLTYFQVAATRLLAVLYPPGAVVAISIVALSGLGAGAALAHGLGRRLEPAWLPVAGALAAAGAVGALAVLAPLVAAAPPPVLATGLLALPTAAVGLALAAAFAAVDRRTGRLVGVWLAAAALGLPEGLGLLLLLAPTALLPLAAAVLAAAGVCAAQAAGRGRRPAAGLLVATGLLALGALALPWPSLPPEAIGPPGSGLGAVLRRAGDALHVEQSRWDAGGRLDIVAGDGRRLAFVDGVAVPSRGPVDLSPIAAPPRERVLTVAPAGPAATALAALGDLAPLLAPLGAASHVTVAGDGRAWLRQQGLSYDLIWLSQPGRPGLWPTGLAEAGNPELTVEAFDDYLRFLSPTGLLVVRLPSEPALQRAALTAVAALEQRGIPAIAAAQHLLAAGAPAPLLAVRLTPYSAEESRAVRARLEGAGWTSLYLPHELEIGALGGLAAGLPARRLAGSLPGVTLVPTIDAAPFFSTLERDLPTPVWLALVLAGLLLLCVLGYLAWTTEPDHYAIWRAVPYAAATGAGGLLVAHAVGQRLTVWLESGLLAMLVATVALGAWAALGAAMSDRVATPQLAPAALWAALLVAVWCALEAFGLLLPVDRISLPPLAGRVAIAAVLLALPGVTLGLPLPVLLRAAQRRYAGRPVALLWSVHGAATALGAAGAVALALRFGITATLLLAAGLFAGLALLARPALAR
jgi:hypothetical protein